MEGKFLSCHKLMIATLVAVLAGVMVLSGCTATSNATTSILTSAPSPLLTSTSTSVSPSATPSATIATPVATSPAVTKTVSYTVYIASKAAVGEYLVDFRGMTLYYTSSDPPGKSTITDELLTVWPVFFMPIIVVPPELNQSDFKIIDRDNGKLQTTYKDHPLYYLSQDKIPGDTLGNGVSGVWFVMNP